MDEPLPIVRWAAPGKYEKLGGRSLKDWLRENHGGRAPTALVPDIEAIVGHRVPVQRVRCICSKMGLKATDANRHRAVERGKASSRVRPTGEQPGVDLDAVWEATRRLAKTLAYKVADTCEVNVDLTDQDKPVCVAEMADLHLGGIGVDYEAIKRDTEAIAATEGMFCAVGGDNLDNFIMEWAATGRDSEAVTASVQWKLFERYLGVIQYDVLYAAIGNHERWTFKRAFVNKFDDLVGQFGILNVGDVGVVHLHVGKQQYVVQRVHKFWGKSRLNPLHAPMRLLDYGLHPNPDVCIVEHEHVPAGGKIWRRGKSRLLVRTGTYKTKDPYARKNNFYGAEVGPCCIIYWPNEHRIHLLHSVAEAAEYLNYLRGS